ncbi:MAG: 4-vinyl reductase [Candidatus Aenigmarchaeota archaeon]|nr:4-vinyl reductase [Candidatus Aenigmarchaeota archaeon]
MLELFNKLLNLKKLEMKEGEIKLLGTSLCLIPPHVYVLLLKELKNMKKEQIIYESSKMSSLRWFANLTKNMGKKSRYEILELSLKILNLLGLGEIKMEKQSEKNTEFSLSYSLTADLWGKNKTPVDYQMSGFLAGLLELVNGKAVVCKEIKCMSQGNKNCYFIIKEDIV